MAKAAKQDKDKKAAPAPAPAPAPPLHVAPPPPQDVQFAKFERWLRHYRKSDGERVSKSTQRTYRGCAKRDFTLNWLFAERRDKPDANGKTRDQTCDNQFSCAKKIWDQAQSMSIAELDALDAIDPPPKPAPKPSLQPTSIPGRYVAPQKSHSPPSYHLQGGGTPPPFMDPPRPRPVSKPARGFQQPREESEGMRNMVAFAASPDCPVKSATSGTYIGLARRDEPNGWAFASDRERNSNDNGKWRAARSFYERAQAWAARRAQQTDASSDPDPAPPPKTVVDLTDDDAAPAACELPAPMPAPTVMLGESLPDWGAVPAPPPPPKPKPAVQMTLDGTPLQMDYVAPDHSAGEQWPGPQRPTRQQTLDAFVAAPRATNFAGESGLPPELADRPRVSLANLLGVTSAATPLRARAPEPAPEPDEEWELTRAAPGEVFDTDRPHSPPRPALAPAAPAPAPPRRLLPAGCIMLSSAIAEEFFADEEREAKEREAKEREAAAKPPKKRKRDPDADVAGGIDDDWRVAGMGRSVLRDFATAKARAIAGKLSFNANSVAIFWKRGDYTTMVKRRTRGGSAGHTDAYTVLSPTLKRLTGKAQLRSELEIQRFFNARPELRDADSVEGE